MPAGSIWPAIHAAMPWRSSRKCWRYSSGVSGLGSGAGCTALIKAWLSYSFSPGHAVCGVAASPAPAAMPSQVWR